MHNIGIQQGMSNNNLDQDAPLATTLLKRTQKSLEQISTRVLLFVDIDDVIPHLLQSVHIRVLEQMECTNLDEAQSEP